MEILMILSLVEVEWLVERLVQIFYFQNESRIVKNQIMT